MAKWQRLLVYLLLNICVSATTTLLVLVIWNAANPFPRAASVGPLYPITPTEISGLTVLIERTPYPTLAPELTLNLIENIYDGGRLSDEKIVLKNRSGIDLLMTGWQIRESDTLLFTFPDFVLNNNGIVNIYSRAGQNYGLQLFIGSSTALWEPGKGRVLVLTDPQGTPRATYKVP